MSRSVEIAPLRASAFQSGNEFSGSKTQPQVKNILLMPDCPVLLNPFNPFEVSLHVAKVAKRWAETTQEITNGMLLMVEAQREMDGTTADIQEYKRMAYSQNPDDRALYYGDNLSRENPKKILIANGFSPSPEVILEMVEEKMAGPYADFYRFNPIVQMGRVAREQFIKDVQKLYGFKSNEILEDFKKQLTRWGHDADFAFEGPNDFRSESFDEFEARVEDETRDGSTVFLAGLSKGGADAEIIAKRHKRFGKNGDIKVIKMASPKVSGRTERLFDEAIPKGGLTGLVHAMAHRSADSKMRRIYEEETRLPLHPDIARNMVSYIVTGDKIVVTDQEIVDPFEDESETGVIIPISGHHASAPYSKSLLRDLGPRLAA